MKITGKNPAVDAQVKLQNAKRELKTRPGSSTDRPVITDKVNLSGRARRLAELRKLIEASPDVRAEKVERLKEAIEDGDYSVKTAKIAEKIIRKAIRFNRYHRYL